MTGFLARLIQRQVGGPRNLQPRLPSLFAPEGYERGEESFEIREDLEPMASHVPKPQDSLPSSVPSKRLEEDPRATPRVTQGSNIHPEEDWAGATVLFETSTGNSLETKPLRSHKEPVGKERVERMEARQVVVFPGEPVQQLPVHEVRDFRGEARRQGRTTPSSPANEQAPMTEQGQWRVKESSEFRSVESMPHPGPRLVKSSSPTPPVVPPTLLAQGTVGIPRRLGLPDRSGQAGVANEPPVHVTIGRIEVTAVPEHRAPKRSKPPREPSVSLSEYLGQEGRRSR